MLQSKNKSNLNYQYSSFQQISLEEMILFAVIVINFCNDVTVIARN